METKAKQVHIHVLSGVMYMCDKKDEEEKDMATTAERVDIRDSLVESVKEVNKIRSGELPKRSWREMMNRVREDLEKK